MANQVLFNEDTYTRCLAEVPKVRALFVRSFKFRTKSIMCVCPSCEFRFGDPNAERRASRAEQGRRPGEETTPPLPTVDSGGTRTLGAPRGLERRGPVFYVEQETDTDALGPNASEQETTRYTQNTNKRRYPCD